MESNTTLTKKKETCNNQREGERSKEDSSKKVFQESNFHKLRSVVNLPQPYNLVEELKMPAGQK